MKDILQKIVLQKQQELKSISYDSSKVHKNTKDVYKIIKEKSPFYISEFKRKSPSEGNIGLEINLEEQIKNYIKAGTSAISVLTDTHFFGGTLSDLQKTVELVKDTNVLVLQKDFIIDEKQIYQARQYGADLILLIARILEPTKLIELKKCAENLGMGVLLELHEAEEYEKLSNEKFELIGINNRDLDTFQISLNRFNVIANELPKDVKFVSESGIQSPLDIAISKKKANAFLVGTSLMRNLKKEQTLYEFYQYNKSYFFKACGLRSFDNLDKIKSDLIGVNFSPISKRKINESELDNFKHSKKLVAVFKDNSYEEIQEIVEKYKFPYIQIYANELSLEELKSLKTKKIVAFNPNIDSEYQEAIAVAKYVDLFILDGSTPGSGKTISLEKAKEFSYPFLLAGGMNINNLDRIISLENCIGVDCASGVEVNNTFDIDLVNQIMNKLEKI
ncbi:MAG: hypothetical protein H6604_04645 [Flavobacteriales bacterium]|nr:hypothetical protein [Flavobacteriales bacterium]